MFFHLMTDEIYKIRSIPCGSKVRSMSLDCYAVFMTHLMTPLLSYNKHMVFYHLS